MAAGAYIGFIHIALDGKYGFRDFAMMLARQYGAYILARDMDLSAELPADFFAPSEHYVRSAQESKEALECFKQSDDAALRRAFEQELADAEAARLKREAELLAERDQICAWLIQANKLPSDGGWKEYVIDMQSKLRDALTECEKSLRFCDEFYSKGAKKSFDEWRTEQLVELERSTTWAAESLEKEIHRQKERKAYHEQLVAMLDALEAR